MRCLLRITLQKQQNSSSFFRIKIHISGPWVMLKISGSHGNKVWGFFSVISSCWYIYKFYHCTMHKTSCNSLSALSQKTASEAKTWTGPPYCFLIPLILSYFISEISCLAFLKQCDILVLYIIAKHIITPELVLGILVI